MTKKEQLLDFLNTNFFDPILTSPYSSDELKYDFNYMYNTIKHFSVEGILIYFWSTMAHAELQIICTHRLEEEGLLDFNQFLLQFKTYFTYEWLHS